MPVEGVPGTRSFPWVQAIPPIASGTSHPWVMSSLGSRGPSWNMRAYFRPIRLDQLWSKGRAPNAVRICPLTEGMMVNSVFRFQVGVYRGLNNPLERIADVVATVGACRVSHRVDGVAVVGSGRYCDAFTVTEYGPGLTKGDAVSSNGKGYLYFDQAGAPFVTINLASNTKLGRVGFEVSGWS